MSCVLYNFLPKDPPLYYIWIRLPTYHVKPFVPCSTTTLNLLRERYEIIFIVFIIIQSLWLAIQSQLWNTFAQQNPSFLVLKIRRTSPRVFCGVGASADDYPWNVLIYYHQQVCGGTLLAPQYVVTAGHCLWWGTPRALSLTYTSRQ